MKYSEVLRKLEEGWYIQATNNLRGGMHYALVQKPWEMAEGSVSSATIRRLERETDLVPLKGFDIGGGHYKLRHKLIQKSPPFIPKL